ncbi:MAG: DUF2330 domain-containing protein [Myxococcales bacterium]|nr:DUF2330 domain-containing protein [Myxococcales bacterium]
MLPHRTCPWWIALILCLPLASPGRARACAPGFQHPQKDLIVFWDEGVEVLVWRALFTRPGAQEPPRSPTPLAWVLAVPAAPLGYALAPKEAFDRTLDWARGRTASPRGYGRGGGGSGGSALRVGPSVQVGEYEITPIVAGREGGEGALNAWLGEHGFPSLDAEAAASYAAEGATFLAIRASVAPDAEVAELRPLAIAFPSERIVIPIRLSNGEAPYRLEVTILSSRVPVLPAISGAALSPRPVRILPLGEPDCPMGLTAILPAASVPASARQLVAPLASQIPSVGRLLGGSLGLSRLSFVPSALGGLVSVEDPSYPLGPAIDPESPAGVHQPYHYRDDGSFAPGEDERSADDAAPSPAGAVAASAAQSPEPAGATTERAAQAPRAPSSAGHGFCAVAPGPLAPSPPTRWSALLLGAGLLGIARLARRRRRAR